MSDAGADDVESWPHSPLRTRIDHAVFSHEVRVRKPDARIYRHALDGLGVEARDAIFVRDGGSVPRIAGSTVAVAARSGGPIASRPAAGREHADEEFADVPAFVRALQGE